MIFYENISNEKVQTIYISCLNVPFHLLVKVTTLYQMQLALHKYTKLNDMFYDLFKKGVCLVIDILCVGKMVDKMSFCKSLDII